MVELLKAQCFVALASGLLSSPARVQTYCNAFRCCTQDSPPLHQLLHPPYLPSSAPLLHRFASSACPIWQSGGVDYTQHTIWATNPAQYTHVRVASFQLVVLQSRVLFVQRHCVPSFRSKYSCGRKESHPVIIVTV